MNTDQIIKQYQAHTFTLPNGLHVKAIGNNVADVFSGEGFGAPTRIRKLKGVWSYVAGPKLATTDYQQLSKALS